MAAFKRKPKPQTPARLHFLFARNAPIGVIFRQGPRMQIRLILWHTDTDTFELGHWLKGKIGVEWANLSPDGTLLIYEAHRWNRGKEEDGYSDAWLAISKPPYLTALTLWPVDWARVEGHFPDNKTVKLTGGGAGWVEPHPKHPIPEKLAVHRINGVGKGLQTRGWTFVASMPTWLHEKPLGRTGFILCQSGYSQTSPSQPLSYTLYDPINDVAWTLDAEQAEVDPKGRLIITRHGKLFVVTIDPRLILEAQPFEETELVNFNDMRFEAIPPPEWATHW